MLTLGINYSQMHDSSACIAHAISACAFSGFDDAALLALDGRGSREAISLFSSGMDALVIGSFLVEK
jgi:predicted NodU family carbamoyl transferase